MESCLKSNVDQELKVFKSAKVTLKGPQVPGDSTRDEPEPHTMEADGPGSSETGKIPGSTTFPSERENFEGHTILLLHPKRTTSGK